jgi:hypothetical protein
LSVCSFGLHHSSVLFVVFLHYLRTDDTFASCTFALARLGSRAPSVSYSLAHLPYADVDLAMKSYQPYTVFRTK